MLQTTKGGGGRWGEWLLGLRAVAGAVLAAWLASGCDSGSFVPPPPEDLQGAERTVPAKFFTPPPSSDILAPRRTGARAIALILARHDHEDAEILKSAARTQGGYEKVKLDVTMLKDQDLPAQQANLVREALALDPLALILEPADTEDKHIAEAVREAQVAGVPVVFLNRSLSAHGLGSQATAATTATTSTTTSQKSADQTTSSSPTTQASKPPALVGAPSFAPSAKQLVESAIRNAKNSGLDPKGGAILVINTVSDAFLDDRERALREALKNAGVDSIEEIRFVYKADLAEKFVAERLQANTKAVLVFGLDSQCLPPIRQFTNKPEFDKHPFIVAGYVSDDRLIPFSQSGDFAALAEFNSNHLLRKAITVAASLAQGKDLPKRLDIPVEFHDSPPQSRVHVNRGDLPGLPRRQDQ